MPYTARLSFIGLLALAACGGKENVREPAKLTDIATPALKPDVRWSASTGGDNGRFSTLRLVLEADALFTADADGNVQALDPQTGAARWTADTNARVVSGPSVSGDLVLVGTLDRELIALKRADGSAAWRAKLSSEVMAPAASDGSVVVVKTVDGRIFGLDATTGARLWATDRSVPNLVLRGASAPLMSAGRVFVGLDNGRVLALSTAEGQPLWEQAVAVPSGRTELDRITDIDAALSADGGMVCAVSYGNELSCLDASNGEPQWRRAIKSTTGMAAVDNLIVVTDEAGTVWALDAASGAAAWKQEGLAYRQLSAPVASAGFVAVADFEGYVHWLDPRDGKLVARTEVGGGAVRSTPVSGESLLYVLANSGRISAVVPSPATP